MSTEDQEKSRSSYSEPLKKPKIPTFAKFVIGGLAGTAGQIATHPMDVIKIHMHITNASLYKTANQTVTNTGWRGLYVGLTAALLRQVTYSTTRLGIYNTLLELCRERFGRLNYATMVSLGMISGIFGSLVGTPADLVMARMISDVKKPLCKRRNYKNAIDGLLTIMKKDGFVSLWRGGAPTMSRAAIVNDLFGEGVLLQFCASMMSSIVTCTASMPVDSAKTEIQTWHAPTKPPGMARTLINIIREKGFFSLWRGLLPYYLRSGPNTVITMITMDQLLMYYTSVFS